MTTSLVLRVNRAPMLRGQCAASAAVMFILTLFCAHPVYADCDVHAGDDLLAWANGPAGSLSRFLAQEDYRSREQGVIFMKGLDEADKILASTADRLRADLDRMRTFEAGAAKMPVMNAAILRENDAQDVLTELLDVNAVLIDVRTRQSALGIAPTLEWMKANGLLNVGRATLLESFMKLGNDSSSNPRERYSVNFQATFDENGNAEKGAGGVNQTVGVDDEIAGVAAFYPPYGTAAAVVYEVIKFGIAENNCGRKIAEQVSKAHQAFDILPGKLITQDEQLARISHSASGSCVANPAQARRIVGRPRAAPARPDFGRATALPLSAPYWIG